MGPTRTGLAALLAALILLSGARNPDLERVLRVGVMVTDETYLAPVQGFRDGLRDLGYNEGQHIAYEIRNASMDRARLKTFAEGFVRERVDLIFTATHIGALAAKEVTAGTRIPVIFAPAGDPVETGLVRSIASSGNNMTGVSTLSLELTGKRLEMLTRIVPGVKRVAILYNPEYAFSLMVARLAHEAGEKLGLTIRDVEGRTEAAMVAAVERLDRREVDALFALPDIMVNNLVKHLALLARAKRLPYMVHIRSLAGEGPLASYGIDTYAIGRQSARLADKIFNGARPSDIPIETPQKLELILNLKVAREIGVTVPEVVIRQADVLLR